jgi:GAF domain-containing protein
LRSVGRLVLPHLADICIIDVLEETSTIRRLAVAHVNPEKQALLNELSNYPPDPNKPHPVVEALRTGRSKIGARLPEPLLPSIAHDERHLTVMQSLNPSSFMVVPLLARGRTLGVVTFWVTESDREYGLADLALAEDLARRAALAVDNASFYRHAHQEIAVRRLTEEALARVKDHLAAQVADLNRLHRLSVQLSTRLDLEPLLRDLLGAVAGLQGGEKGMVLLHDPQTSKLSIAVDVGFTEEQRQVFEGATPGVGPCEVAFAEQRRVIVEDVEAEPDFPIVKAAKRVGFRSINVNPLVTRTGESIGVIARFFPEHHHLSDREVRRTELYARQAAEMIDNARLYDAERGARAAAEDANRRTARLQTVTAALSEALTFDQVADAILTEGVAALEATAGSVALLVSNSTTLEVVQDVGYPSEVLESSRCFSINAPLPMAQTARTASPVLLDSREAYSKFPGFEDLPACRENRTTAALPLSVEGRVFGTLGFSFAGPRHFTEAEYTFLTTLAQQCSQALERARLCEAERLARSTAQMARNHLALLDEASRILATSLDYETTLATVAELAAP